MKGWLRRLRRYRIREFDNVYGRDLGLPFSGSTSPLTVTLIVLAVAAILVRIF